MLDEGLAEAELALLHHGPNLKILKYIFRFNMRFANWQGIKKRINQYRSYEKYDHYKVLFRVNEFECDLRRAYDFAHDKFIFYQTIYEAKYFLEDIPNRIDNDDYNYMSGRYFLELFWAFPDRGIANVEHALHHLNKVLLPGWWITCYKCIALKLLGKTKEFQNLLLVHKKMVFDLRKKEPEQASLKIHSATCYILAEDKAGLKKFIAKVSKPKSSRDFQNSLWHHVEIIFYDRKDKIEEYKDILSQWN